MKTYVALALASLVPLGVGGAPATAQPPTMGLQAKGAWQEAGEQPPGGLSLALPVENALESNGKSLNSALREVAQALAAILVEAQTRRVVKEEVGKRFDGDYDALYREIANQRIGSALTFRQALGNALAKVQKRAGTPEGRSAALRKLDAYTSAYPQLQISIPVGFQNWNDEEHVPLVAFTPTDVNDQDVREIEAFDAAGHRYLLDARTEPGFPVVVVGLNERTDRNGYLLNEFVQPKSRDRAIDGLIAPGEAPPLTSLFTSSHDCGGADVHSYGEQELLLEIKINDDGDGWPWSDPEIYAAYSFADNAGIRGQHTLADVNVAGRWYPIEGALFYWQRSYGDTFVMSIWEHDGGAQATFTYSIGGRSFSVQIENDDDSLGAAPVNFLDPNCGYYNTGGAEFKLGYVCSSCFNPCAGAICGNGACEDSCGESIWTCPSDCVGGACGDGTCDVLQGECASNCPQDCTSGESCQ
jgi:hypothetical protein